MTKNQFIQLTVANCSVNDWHLQTTITYAKSLADELEKTIPFDDTEK